MAHPNSVRFDMVLTHIAKGVLCLSALALSGCGSLFSSDAAAPLPPTPSVASQPSESEEPPEARLVAVNTGSYQLGEGDEIAIQVFDEPDLTMDALVGASGSINYSYLGDVTVAGKTTVQLERFITGLLRDGYLVNPSVNVSIKQYRPFYIGGEVRQPGSYPYQPGLTLNRAIALAGGLTDRASSRRIFISKPNGDEFRAGQSQAVAPGDTISIKEGFF